MPAAERLALVRGFAMSNYVLKYKRGEEVKYISHLDFIRFIQRVIRRAGLSMSFSQGFNPHPLMSVALPLSVGVTAVGELMKIAFEEDYAEEELKGIINSALPKGFEIVKVKKTQGKEIDFAQLDRAVYVCKCELKDCSAPDINAFLENKVVNVMKKSKSGIKEADIRPHIHSLEITDESNGELTLKMCVDAGNAYNLKPDTVIEAMKKYTDGFDVEFYNVHRSALLSGNAEIL